MKFRIDLNRLAFLVLLSAGQIALQAQDYIYHPFASNVVTPNAIVNIDLDRDGDEDYVCVSSGDNKISWFENLGNYVTAQHIISTTIPGAAGIEVTDLDGDFDLDIITHAPSLHQVIILENVHHQIFRKKILPNNGMYDQPVASAVGDLDMDGDLDIITSAYFDLVLFENDGSGNFQTHKIDGFVGRYEVRLADMDRDGDLDIISRGNQEAIFLVENQGNWVFQGRVFGLNGFHAAMDIFDYNGDSLPDIVTGSYLPAAINVFINNGDWTITKIPLFDILGNVSGLIVTDVDYDTDVDFIVSVAGGINEIMWYEVIPGPSQVPHPIGRDFYKPFGIQTCFFNADTLPDILALDEEKNYATILVRQPDLTYREFPLGNAVSNGAAIATDLDLDGDPDLLRKLGYLTNHGNGYFTQHPLSGGDNPVAIDFDKDGDVDILTHTQFYGNAIAWKINDGQQHYQDSIIITGLEDFAISIFQVLDINQDGHYDIFTNSGSRGNSIFINNGQFQFTRHRLEGELRSVVSYPQDFDRDGDTDILMGNDKSFSWYENIGADTMIRHKTDLISGLYGARLAQGGDLDGDGDLDVSLAGSYQGNDHAGWLENDGNYNFGEQHPVTDITNHFEKPRLWDKDNDGDLDVLDHNASSDYLYWNENHGNGNFTPYYFTGQVKLAIPNPAITDLDNDNDADIVIDYGWYECLFNQPQVTCITFFDDNKNGIKDDSEKLFTTQGVTVTPYQLYYFKSTPHLQYVMQAPGTYVFEFDTIAYPLYDMTTPSRDTVLLVSDFQHDTVYFGIYPNTTIYASLPFLHAGPFICSRRVNGTLYYFNTGTVIQNGTLWLEIDSTMLFEQATPAPDFVTSPGKYGWVIDGLGPEEFIKIPYRVKIPSASDVSPGDSLFIHAYALVDSQAVSLMLDTIHFGNPMLCAIDPNDKLASPNRSNHEIFTSECVTYTIRFQNIGNYSATDVFLFDTLDSDLDLKSFRFIASSHTPTLYYDVDSSGSLFVKFTNIHLPDSTSNYDGSQGFFAYSICPEEHLAPHTEIRNRALIYFDANEPITTNQTLHITAGTPDNVTNGFTDAPSLFIYPTPTQDALQVKIAEELNTDVEIVISSVLGMPVDYGKQYVSGGSLEVNVRDLAPGCYSISIIHHHQHWWGKFIKL